MPSELIIHVVLAKAADDNVKPKAKINNVLIIDSRFCLFKLNSSVSYYCYYKVVYYELSKSHVKKIENNITTHKAPPILIVLFMFSPC